MTFLVFAAAVRLLLVARLGRKRQTDLGEIWPAVIDNLASAGGGSMQSGRFDHVSELRASF